MKKQVVVAGAVLAALLAGGGGGRAGAQVEQDARGEVETRVREPVPESPYAIQPWEHPGLEFPLLGDGAVVAVSEDDDQLTFVTGGELGQFRPAPEGGSVFFGAGQPIFGLAAPPVLPSRVLRPLGSGDTGDRFLGQRPPVDPTTVIPKLDETFDQRRESFAFLGGPPPVVETNPSGTTPFPLVATVEADPTPGVPDNVPSPPPEPETPGTPRTTTTFAPGPRPSDPPRSTTTVPTSTTVPRGTTTTTRPTTTTTTRPATTTTSTTSPSTTTTTSPSTTTTSPPPTTTTTTTTPTPTTIPDDPPPVVSTAFVLGNQRESATTCLSNGTGSVANTNQCDRLFDITDATPGETFRINLTLWNVDPDSEADAVDLRAFSGAVCQNGTVGPAPWGSNTNLCGAVQLKIQRYQDAARNVPTKCVYGGGTATACDWGAGRTLGHFSSTHTTMGNGAQIDNNFVIGEKAYLTIDVRLPNRGFDPDGRGRDNEYMGRTASLRFTWRMDSA